MDKNTFKIDNYSPGGLLKLYIYFQNNLNIF